MFNKLVAIEPVSLIPVSYTHLYDPADPEKMYVEGDRATLGAEVLYTVIGVALLVPVSYTHLDQKDLLGQRAFRQRILLRTHTLFPLILYIRCV